MNNDFYTVRRSAIDACIACESPAEWESALSDAFQQLQNQGTVSSWSVSSYGDGVSANFTIPGEPIANLVVLSRSGQHIRP